MRQTKQEPRTGIRLLVTGAITTAIVGGIIWAGMKDDEGRKKEAVATATTPLRKELDAAKARIERLESELAKTKQGRCAESQLPPNLEALPGRTCAEKLQKCFKDNSELSNSLMMRRMERIDNDPDATWNQLHAAAGNRRLGLVGSPPLLFAEPAIPGDEMLGVQMTDIGILPIRPGQKCTFTCTDVDPLNDPRILPEAVPKRR